MNPVVRFSFLILAVAHCRVVSGELAGDTKLTEFSVTPADLGRQLVRTSLPFRPGVLGRDQELIVTDGEQERVVSIRPLTWHPGKADMP